MRLVILTGMIWLAMIPAAAGELVFFTSGSHVRADRHEVAGEVIRLYQGTGVSEVPAAMVAGFEEYAAAEVPAANPVLAVAEVPPVVAAPPAISKSTDPLTLIREAAAREGLPAEFVESVARAESALRPTAISPKGAIGVMQLMPDTAKALGADPYDVQQNIDAGTRLLRDLLVKYDGDVIKALSAYNAGPGAVTRYNGLPPYDETRRYVNRVIGAYQQATSGD